MVPSDDTVRLSYVSQTSTVILQKCEFEKSLYDLIRGLRNHKGIEREYIQHSLQECRSEIKGADMDLKATALLKLIYLEMFGHDMSWASFHVLEVMSSPKYLQKRVGYLAAVQSFRPDTEVLMLATNLLKKDISSSLPPTISLPLVTLPHIITSPLALSLLSDLLPRLSHSNMNIRKKTVAALYRLALVYPDSLKFAWPKIKDVLLDEEQDSSVTAAVVNVVCELGWRRPREFLSLAPRLFELLIDGGNNWMAIKIIKLFASLTPLEPRLIKKLLPPLTSLIRTTPAMSLLYECISGVIQGGILEGTSGAKEGEEVACLCVNKLRGMIVVEGDPNLRYVALLAFNKIAASYPHLVFVQEDVIMSCIDDSDVSIRLKALELSAGMVNSDSLVAMVERLLQQLRSTQFPHGSADDGRNRALGVEPAADSDGENPEEALRQNPEVRDEQQALPQEYRVTVIRQILTMCSKNTYDNIRDFEWYIGILLQLVKLAPSDNITPNDVTYDQGDPSRDRKCQNVFSSIGWELRNVAVRVSTVREEAVKAASSLIAAFRTSNSSNAGLPGSENVLSFAAWIVGEYVCHCGNGYNVLDVLLLPSLESLPPYVICAYIQAIPKVLAHTVSEAASAGNPEQMPITSSLVARIERFLQPLTNHPDLDVQERAVEFSALMRVGCQASDSSERDIHDLHLVLSKTLPRLFSNFELRPVAPTAQRKVPIPIGLKLDTPINNELPVLLLRADQIKPVNSELADFESFYRKRPIRNVVTGPAVEMLPPQDLASFSYQQTDGSATEAEITMRKRLERRERHKDDPFYIEGGEAPSETSTPLPDILLSLNGEEVDVASIPIRNLEFTDQQPLTERSDLSGRKNKKRRSKMVHVAEDETIDYDNFHEQSQARSPALTVTGGEKRCLLEVDSSGLGTLSLGTANVSSAQTAFLQTEAEDLEMARALAEVERLRLEMQRASERVQAADGAPAEGTLVKKKKNKKVKQKESSIFEDGADRIIGPDTVGLEGGVIIEKKRGKRKQRRSHQG